MVSWVWWLYPLKKKTGWTTCLFWFKPPASNGMLGVVLTCCDLAFHNSQFYSMLSFWTTRSLSTDTLGKIHPFIPSTLHLKTLVNLLRIQPRGLVDLMKALDVLGIHDVTWKHGMSRVISHHLTSDHRCKFPRNPQKNDFTKKNLTKIKTRYSKMRGSQHHINGISWNHPRPSTSHLFPGSFHFQKGIPT